jgi:hypothetical protein
MGSCSEDLSGRKDHCLAGLELGSVETRDVGCCSVAPVHTWLTTEDTAQKRETSISAENNVRNVITCLNLRETLMTTEEKKNVAIAFLAGALGVAIIGWIHLYSNGGPAPADVSQQSPGSPSPAVGSAASSSLSGDTPPQDPTLSSIARNEPSPVFDWVNFKKESFVLDAGAIKSYGPLPPSNTSPSSVRFDVRSTSPVNIGLVDMDSAEQAQVVAVAEGTADCFQGKVLSSELTCPALAVEHIRLMVYDTRQPVNAIQIAGAYLGAKEPLKRATAENRVTLTFYAWQCVQHCGTRQHQSN